MNKNMDSIDRVIRLIIAAGIAILYFTNLISGTVGIILLILAVVFVLTSFIGFCPLYALFGLNTRSAKKKE